MGLDDAGIDRILNYVGDAPGTLDKSELRKDILAAWDFYQGYKRENSKGAKTERREHATKIAHKTNELIHLLNDPAGDWVRSRIGRLLSLREADLPYAWIAPPKDFVGSADLVAELRLPNAQIADRQTLHVKWTRPAQEREQIAPPRQENEMRPAVGPATIQHPNNRDVFAGTQSRDAELAHDLPDMNFDRFQDRLLPRC
jgi:hypothetical protein